jgi:uncharacterized membrane protein
MTIVISFIVTGEMDFALSIALIEFVAKIFLFYLHERIGYVPQLWRLSSIRDNRRQCNESCLVRFHALLECFLALP